MKRKVVVCLLVAVCAAAAQANLLTNAGFEDADLSPWAIVNGGGGNAGWSVDTDPVNSGLQSAMWNNDKWAAGYSYGSLTQTVAVVAGENYSASYYYTSTSGSYTMSVIVEWLDAGAAVLDSASTSEAAVTGAWQLLSLTAVAPENAVSANFIIDITSGATAKTNINVDDASMDVVPEPATMILLGVGSLLLRRRK